MAQEFHVLRCVSCQSFQVQQVKKVNRWSCKLCGEKQSLLKEFGRGSGVNCRRHVQKLNAMRGAMMEEPEHHTWSLWKQVEAVGEDEPEEHDQVSQAQVSRWSKYLDTPEEEEPEEEEEENVVMDRQQLRGNNMTESGQNPVDLGLRFNLSVTGDFHQEFNILDDAARSPGSPWTTSLPSKRRERKQSRGCRSGSDARLRKQPHSITEPLPL